MDKIIASKPGEQDLVLTPDREMWTIFYDWVDMNDTTVYGTYRSMQYAVEEILDKGYTIQQKEK